MGPGVATLARRTFDGEVSVRFVKTIGSVIIGGVAVFAGTQGFEDDTTRDDTGDIVESGGLGAFVVQVGDCVSDPGPASMVQSFEGVPCSEPHYAQAYAQFDLTGAERYPSAIAMGKASYGGCIDRWTAAIGSVYESDQELDAIWLSPSAESWRGGDREVLCLVTSLDGSPLVGSKLRPGAHSGDAVPDSVVVGDDDAVLHDDCAAFSSRLEEIQAEVRRDVPAVYAGLGARADELLAVIGDAPEVIRDEVRTIAGRLRAIGDAFAVGDLAASRGEVDPFDSMTSLWGADGHEAMFAISEHCGVLAASKSVPVEVFAQLFVEGAELDAFAVHGLVGWLCTFGHCDATTGGLSGLMGEASSSGMDDEAQVCWDDLEAARLGDNTGCDALYRACRDGNLLACNDLGDNATAGSEYARFGDSCGNRADAPVPAQQGRCELIE